MCLWKAIQSHYDAAPSVVDRTPQDTIARANCSFHSVDMHCEDRELEGPCPTCQNPNDVISVADWEYFRRHRPEDMIVTGFGRHRYDTDDYYILLTFDPEKREMYWFPLYSLRHKVSKA
jgi:hypothetical protein